MLAPLFTKYQSTAGNHYVYDRGSNEIVRVGAVVYEILDDFRVLYPDEIVEKHKGLGEGRVRRALEQLDSLQSRGILCDHTPEVQSSAEQIAVQGKDEAVEDILTSRRRSLTLELTQQCNLRCEYCCYGEHYPNKREHNDSVMSLETAQNAVRRFLAPASQSCRIGFYGGEPLLEFGLLKEIVAFTEKLAADKGGKVEFSISTNGTLLTDEKIHFLVAHGFSVSISLDGPKESHDRYRIYRNETHPEQRIGSFDIIMKNIMRFAELYPTYKYRSILMVLTSTTDLEAANELVRRMRALHFGVSPAIVDKAPSKTEGPGSKNSQSSQCGGSCGKQELYTLQPVNRNRPMVVNAEAQGSEAPDFDNWTPDRKNCFELGRERFLNEMAEAADSATVAEKFPILATHFNQTNRRLHHRQLRDHAPQGCFNCGCFPGTTRTFYNVRGELFPCEKTETGQLFQLGNAQNGVDVERPKRLMEFMRLLGDCGNCIAQTLCTKCPASVSELGDTGRPDALDYQRTCRRMVQVAKRQLVHYTSLMEENSAVVEEMLTDSGKADWHDSVAITLKDDQRLRSDVEVGVEECEAALR